jgi:3-oxoacyl-[acyl-carrier protein] reductase
MQFAGQAVLVVGGSSGIGLATARMFAAKGADVAISGTRGREACGPELDGLDHHRLDLGRPGDTEALLAAWKGRRLDVLVNAAGATHYRQAEFEPEVFRSVLEINLAGIFALCAGFHDALAESARRGAAGTVVNIASLAGIRAAPNNPAYTASKAGLIALTQGLAAKWGADGIRLNAVAPGFVPTKLTEKVRNAPSYEDTVRRTPLGRWGSAEEIAACVCFLASAEASFITGAVLVADGGYSLSI